jgi:repressor LexA
VMGRIVASAPVPVPASDFNYYDVETSVEIATSLLPTPEKNKQLFALEVDGDSMIDAMVNDGDFVIMKPVASNAEVRNGEMVAVWLPSRDETTLKYFYKEKEGYRLQPANPTMQPIMIKKEEPLEIKGKVVMVIRKVDTVAV